MTYIYYVIVFKSSLFWTGHNIILTVMIEKNIMYDPLIQYYLYNMGKTIEKYVHFLSLLLSIVMY